MAAVMIGVDPHKGSHIAVVISAGEESLGQVRVRASAVQAQRLLSWAGGLARAHLGGGGCWRPGAPAGSAAAGRG